MTFAQQKFGQVTDVEKQAGHAALARQGSSSAASQVLESNPLLEAFGNEQRLDHWDWGFSRFIGV